MSTARRRAREELRASARGRFDLPNPRLPSVLPHCRQRETADLLCTKAPAALHGRPRFVELACGGFRSNPGRSDYELLRSLGLWPIATSTVHSRQISTGRHVRRPQRAISASSTPRLSANSMLGNCMSRPSPRGCKCEWREDGDLLPWDDGERWRLCTGEVSERRFATKPMTRRSASAIV